MDSFETWLPLLLTAKEIKDLQKRFQIVQLLKTNLTYREIAQKMGISTTTVVHLNQRLKIRKVRKPSLLQPRKKQVKQSSSNLPWKFG